MIEVILFVVDDKNLPCVPPISVKVPELYPQVSPQCDTKTQDYGKWAVSFILKNDLSSIFEYKNTSITAILIFLDAFNFKLLLNI